MKIKVTKCSEGTQWYKDHIGEIFEVNGESPYSFSVNHGCYYEYYVYKGDCEVVKDKPKFSIGSKVIITQPNHGKNFRFGESNMMANGVLDYEDHWKLWQPPHPKFTKDTFVVDDDGDYGRIVSMEYKGNSWTYKLSDCVDNDDLWTKAEGDIEVA